MSELTDRQSRDRDSQADPSGVPTADAPATEPSRAESPTERPTEVGGPKGPEPTRYGDWEVKGRCSDF